MVESALLASCALWLVAPTWRWTTALPGAVLRAEFAYYEFLAEPLGWTGSCWERGERDGETFTWP